MIGGKIDNVSVEGKVALISVRGIGSESNDTRDIVIEHAGENLQYGDSIWWQSGHAYWTPHDRSREDVPLVILGYARRRPG